MRISLLEKREDFYQILSATLNDLEIIPNDNFSEMHLYYVNKYLNFIASGQLQIEMFEILVKEYSNSIVGWKKTIQKIYVWAAVTPYFRSLLAKKKIKLPGKYSGFLILGGNHRLRLFSPQLRSTYVVLKKGESVHFIKNEIKLKTQIKLSYAPQLISSGKNWIQETYFEGTPLNRIQDIGKQNEIIEKVISRHYKELLCATLEYQAINDFKEQRLKELNCIISNKELSVKSEYIKNIEQTFTILTNNLTLNFPVPVSWTHGDFQMANILDSSGDFMVIDWEASALRFSFYDLFVLLGGMRIHGSFLEALQQFTNKIQNYSFDISLSGPWQVLIALEELFFAINEDCSANFYHSGKNIQKLCFEITSLFKK